VKKKSIHVIGGGLAGTEAAWQIAKLGLPVSLYEMRPERSTDAHITNQLAELVCSNSFRSDDSEYNAVGLLHDELRQLDSLILKCADLNKVPAGAALAVDRVKFSESVESFIEQEPLISVNRQEIKDLADLSDQHVIIATGPLTSPDLSEAIKALTGDDSLAFFDAIAPIVYRDSINFDKAWCQSRYDKGDGDDYINCPMSQLEYDQFVSDLIQGQKVSFHEWEENTPYFEGCLPIEVLAERGHKTLAFGPLKPVGLTNPNNPNIKPAAIVQLRQDNSIGTLFNIVGFQTKLTYSEQKRIFRKIPGMEEAEFARLGGLHRNTFINSPKLLNDTLSIKSQSNFKFAGQITGCEGYVESTCIGLFAGKFAAFEIMGQKYPTPPRETACGSLLTHITGGANTLTYQPMNINFGLFPDLNEPHSSGKKIKGRDRKLSLSARAKQAMTNWLKDPAHGVIL